MRERYNKEKWLFAPRFVSGVTLIELMVAMVIGFLIITTLMELFISTQRHYRLQFALNDIQYEAKSVISFLRNNIQTSNVSCLLLKNQLKMKNNRLIVNRMGKQTGLLHETMQTPNYLLVSSDENYHVNDKLVISDCHHTEVFSIFNLSSHQTIKKIIPANPLHFIYEKGAAIARFSTSEFYVENNHLYMQEEGRYKQSLAKGISHLKMQFTIWNEGEWLDMFAEQIDDWTAVVGVDVEFDVSSFGIQKHWETYIPLSDGVNA